MDAHPEVAAVVEVLLDHPRQVLQGHHHLGDPVPAQEGEDVLHHRGVHDGHHRLGAPDGQRTGGSPHPGHDDGLHGLLSSAGTAHRGTVLGRRGAGGGTTRRLRYHGPRRLPTRPVHPPRPAGVYNQHLSGRYRPRDRRHQHQDEHDEAVPPSLRQALTTLLALCTLLAPLTALWPRRPAPKPPYAQSQLPFFPETGFRLANPQFADFFTKRGGLRTFGYPVSREFLFLGTRVQFFQRQIMQIRPDGNVGTLNILDEDLMPYTRINGSVFPATNPP